MTEYTPQSLQVCKKVVRSLSAESGVWGPKCVVIGGLVPSLLQIDPPEGLAPHLGTTDVDLGIQVAALTDEVDLYRTLKSVLTKLGFRQVGAEPSFAWMREVDGFPAKIELFCPAEDPSLAGKIRKKPFDEAGSGVTALSIYGLDLLERDTVLVEDFGPLLDDRGVKQVSLPVCGPAMLILLKAWALHERTKEKDPYDIVWLLKAIGPDVLAHRYRESSLSDQDAGIRALEFIQECFASPNHTGPQGWVTTAGFTGDTAQREKREAVGIVAEFCRLCRE